MSDAKTIERTEVRMTRTDEYRESYANSVQVRMSVWDFQLVFGTMQQESTEGVTLANFQGIYLSPQQAKALHSVLTQNLAQYEHTFGKLSLEPVAHGAGPGLTVVPPSGGPVN